MFKDYNIDWAAIYMPYYVQYLYAIFSIEKLNVLFLNKKNVGILRFFCYLHRETLFHILYECDHVE